MKLIAIIMFVGSMAVIGTSCNTSVGSGKEVKLDNLVDTISYCMGAKFGYTSQRQKLPYVNTAATMEAFKATYTKKGAKFTEEEVNTILTAGLRKYQKGE